MDPLIMKKNLEIYLVVPFKSLIGTRPIGVFGGGLDSAMIAFHANKFSKQNTFTNHILPCPHDPDEDYNSDSDEAKKFANF